jgi:signal transduction histidine kinase
LAGRRTPRRPMNAAWRLEKSQADASIALGAVSSYLQAEIDLPMFFGRLTTTVAGVLGAKRVAFWRLLPEGALLVQREPFGFAPQSPIRALRILPPAEAEGIAERIVLRDELEIRDGTSPELDRLWRANGMRGIRNSIAVSWTAGDRPIGALAAYDARYGFTDDDAWLLRIVSRATGLVWRYRQAEDQLDVAVERLGKAMAARRHLLANVAAGGDDARRRFASALHDDSLQLLTAAELQLERVRNQSAGSPQSKHLEQLAATLQTVEDSLRRLLTNVSPEASDLGVGLDQAIRDRLEVLRVHSGIEPDVNLRVPDDMPDGMESVVFKNVTEAITNVEKHAHAAHIHVSAAPLDGGLAIEVADDGTGFVVDEYTNLPGHLGLMAMKERALLAGGWCRIVSEPGAGTKVEFWVPTQ